MATTPARRPKLKVSRKHRKIIQRFLREFDPDAFWDKVTKRAAPEIGAYHYAQAKSRGPNTLLAT